MPLFKNERVLVAPLDWGLGHATRCIPVIRALIQNGADPVIAADNGPRALLMAEFPELSHIQLRGIEVRYAEGANQLLAMFRQWPRLMKSIQREHAELEQLIIDQNIRAVISDQRFGLWSKLVPSVIMTHQLHPFTPFAQNLLRAWNTKQLKRYDRIWVVDHVGDGNLAGALSNGNNTLEQAHFIGPLSRWLACSDAKSEHTVVAVISGPEPQREILQDRVIEQLADIPGKHLVVCGTPLASNPESKFIDITIEPHLSTEMLRDALCGASFIVARSGYSAIMDLHALERTALLIPTPGQSEQEHLAGIHSARGWCFTQRQGDLDIRAALKDWADLSKPTTARSEPLLERALQDLAATLRT